MYIVFLCILFFIYCTKNHVMCMLLKTLLLLLFREKPKMPKFGTKNALFEYFGVRFLKNYCHIWNQHPRICQTTKFREEIKMSKFGTKNTLFGYFGTRILENYCHTWNQHPRIYRIAKFPEKTKMPKFGTKNALFG